MNRKEAHKHKKHKSYKTGLCAGAFVAVFVSVLIAFLYALGGKSFGEIFGNKNYWLTIGVANGLLLVGFLMLYRIDAQNIALKENDLEDTEWLTVKRNRLYTKEFGIYEKEPKTATSIRDIPLTDALINELTKYMDWFRQADDHFDERLDEYYVAVNLYRLPIFPHSIGQYLKRYEKAWHMKEVTCHGLRHTYCSLLLSQNVPIQTVSKYMGHSDSTITLKVYSHFIPDTQDTAINALNNLL